MSQRILSFKHRVDGVLTDATSAVLSDPTGTFGLVRTDSGEILVDAGTAFTKIATGTYQYTLSDPAAGLTYQYWIEVVYGGVTKRIERYSPPPDASEPAEVTAAEMVLKIRAALAANPIGVVTVVVDGQTVTYSRQQALEELKFWQREAAKEGGTRPRAASIYLGGF